MIGRVRGEGRVPPPLVCEVAIENETAWVHLVGELDLASAPNVDARLTEVAADRPRELVVDLGELTFIDSSGLRLLVTWVKTAASAGIDFSIVPAKPSVQRVFSIAGVEELLPFRPPPGAD